MPVIVVDTLQSVRGDGHTSMQEAFKAAVEKSLATGHEVTIRFSSAMEINLAKTLVVPVGARIVIDGAIEGDNTIETGSNDVAFHGTIGGIDTPSGEAFGHTMVKVAAGGTLWLSDVELSGNTVVGAAGNSGKSGDNGINGNSGTDPGLPGSAGNGGLSVATNGHDGKDAVSGILNMGTLVLDRVNLNALQAYAGDGGSGGSGGKGGDGGNGNQAPAGAGGPGGSGTGHGANGGDAAGGVMNYGTLTMMDTTFQTDFVFSGGGGAGGSGGSGGDGGNGTIGGFGGNGGSAGNGGNGGAAAITVFNQGTMNLVGGWVYAPGANLIWGGSGAAGAAGGGGAGGNAGHGSEMNGFDGVGGSNGSAGQAGAGAAAIGWSGTTVATSYFIESNHSTVNEYKGAAGQGTSLIIYRMGDVSAAGSVTISISALTGGATGSNLQDGLDSVVVNFAAGSGLEEITIFAWTDHAQNGDQDYRFTLTGANGGVLGGHVSTDLTVRDTDQVGDGLANTMAGGKGDEVITAGAGNDTIIGSAGDDQIDGGSGIDTLDYSGVQEGNNGVGLTADVGSFAFSGKGVGTDEVFNVDVIIASAFNDKIIGGFNGERFLMGAGDDTVSGNFGNDTLLGMGGDDRLTGGDLNDSLSGGAGQDVLIGGSGRDAFVFDVALIAGNLDHIADFKAVDDVIQLGRTGPGPFDALSFGALDPQAFHLGTTAAKASQHVLYDRATGTLAYDADGTGGAAAVVFAILDNMPKIDAADFFVL